MNLRYTYLSQNPKIFHKMTGLKLIEFQVLSHEILPLLAALRTTRLSRPNRKRQMGGGSQARLEARDQLLMTLIWLRLYPTNEVLGYLFSVSDSTASRVLSRVLPLLAQNGLDSFKLKDPGRKQRRTLPQIMAQIPELNVIVDSFEQRVQRPRDRQAADQHYSGKKKQHTLKSQIAVEAGTGRIIGVSESVVGPTADIKLLEQSGLLQTLPVASKVGGDLGYVGIASLLPERGFTPRRKPRAAPRVAEDVAYNTAFATVRIEVEHTLGRMRHYQALTQTDRHHRRNHTRRVQAVGGLVNRQIKARVLKYRLAA